MNTLYIIIFFLVWWLIIRNYIADLSALLSEFHFKRDQFGELINFLSGDMQGEAPIYKFYSSLIDQLISARNRYGTPVSDLLREIKKNIILDHKITRKINSQLNSLITQYIALCIFTWGYLWQIHQMLEIKYDHSNFTFLALWQGVGVLTALALYHFLKTKTFRHFQAYFHALYMFKSLMSISWPIAKVISKSEINTVPNSGAFKHTYLRVQKMTHKLKTEGQIKLEDIDLISQELQDLYEVKLDDFYRGMLSLKFMILAIFVIPGFMLSTFSIIGGSLL